MTRRVVALHGVPLGPATYSRLELPGLTVPRLAGLATLDERTDWSPAAFAAEVAPHVDAETLLVGHDLGGLIAAIVATSTPVAGVVLTGTALGPYWTAIRATALPGLRHGFYRRWAGRRFLAGGVDRDRRAAFLEVAEPELGAIPDLPRRMEAVARAVRGDGGLARRLADACPVRLVWGRRDRWYPPPVALALARATGAPITWLDAAHYAMWEQPAAFAAAVSSSTG